MVRIMFADLRRLAVVLTALLLAGCAEPPAPGPAPALAIGYWAPSPLGRSPLSRARPITFPTATLPTAEAALLADGWIDAGGWSVELADLPAWDEARRRCPRREGPAGIGLCRLQPRGAQDHDLVLVDAARPAPWLLLLPVDGPAPGPVDVIDTGGAILMIRGSRDTQ
jgi:hypothetical protein